VGEGDDSNLLAELSLDDECLKDRRKYKKKIEE
jgi:hypothetical protein